MDMAAIYIVIPGYYRRHGNKCPFSINLPYSLSCYLNVSFIYSTILDCLLAFQMINDKENLIINKLFCYILYLYKVTTCTLVSTLGSN